jgi:formylglycine-generating enzyme required for sulfatase activity
MDKLKNKFYEQIFIGASQYIYRVQHRIMEGDCQFDHGPRLVEVSPFYIDKYPVTNEKFKYFLDDSGYWPKDDSNFLKHWNDGTYPEELANHPVIWVSLKDARTYARWAGCRLPKDAEWQWAACGREKYKWPWGNQFDRKLCNADGTDIMPVDSFPGGTSPFGCCDMCGNAWEWIDEVQDEGHHLFTFIRGGSYYKAPHFWHAEGGPHTNDYHLKFQLLNEGLNRCATVGFRCIKDGECNDK